MDLVLRLGVDEGNLRATNNRKEISSVKKWLLESCCSAWSWPESWTSARPAAVRRTI